MFRVLNGFVLGILATTALFVALDNHFIRTSDRWIVERKTEAALNLTYVDTREWRIVDYARNPGITAILAKHGVRRLLGSETGLLDEGKKVLDEAAEKLRGAGR